MEKSFWSFVAGRLFLSLQILFFAFVIVGLLLYRKRQKEREKAMHLNPENLGKGFVRKREPFQSQGGSSDSAEPGKVFLSTTFPSWNEHTPATEILGVSRGTDELSIERAYRERMKKYHPDKYASDGIEYQRRAHEIVLLLQKAKKELIGD